MNKRIWGVGGLFFIFFFGFWILERGYFLVADDTVVEPTADTEPVALELAPLPEPVPEEPQPKKEAPKVKRDPSSIPFIVQAPNGEWDNPLFENACEEASLLMVASFLRGTTKISQEESRQELLALAVYQKKQFGHSIDTSVFDTNEMLREYFGIAGRVMEMRSEQDMRKLIGEGALLIVPADGQKLGNPFFTPPGPINHMLVVLTYDDQAGEYITHDPGTKRGALYRYKTSILWGAIRDYPTGAEHLPNTKKEKRLIAIPL